MLFAFFFLVLISNSNGQNPEGEGLKVIYGEPGSYHIGILGSTNATYVYSHPYNFPDSKCKNGWSLESGTKGQTSTVFFINGTWFQLATQTCEGKVLNRSLVSFYGPYQDGYGRMFVLSELNDRFPGLKWEQFNIAWDWTCNVFVIAPTVKDNTLVYESLEISDYDGQVRPQATYSTPICDQNSADCWRKVDGFSAFDPQSPYPGVWNHGEELNCGDQCVLVTLNERVVKGVAQVPRKLIGRSARTASVLYNVTEPLQITTMTYWPGELDLFIGLGVCCDLSLPGAKTWCTPACANKAGKMVLFSWDRKNKLNPFTVQQTFGTQKQAIKVATQLGVAIDGSKRFEPSLPKYAYVMWNSYIYTYLVEMDNNNVVTHKKSVSSKVDPLPIMWTTPQVF